MNTKRRLNVHLHVTPVCNLQCKHCYYDSWRAGAPERLLSVREMAAIIIGLSDDYAASFDVEGGEMFLRDDIAELFDSIPQDYWRNVTITTNGTIAIPVSPSRFLNLDEFRVSVEGHTNDLQKEIRGITLEPVLDTCSYLRSHNVPVTLRITLHKRNFLQLPEMVAHFVSLGFTAFSLYEFQSVGRGASHCAEYGLETTDLEEVLGLLCRCPIEKPVTLKLSLSARRVPIVLAHQQILARNGFEVVDLAGVPSLSINYNGVIGVCPWNTWNIGPERIGVFEIGGFRSLVSQCLQNGLLNHECDHCSAIRILVRPQR